MPSPKQVRADIIRDQYIKAKRREGLYLSDADGAWVQYGSHAMVMPFAQELRTNRWLHHVQATVLEDQPHTPYVILLCERRDGEVVDIIIPPGRARTILRKSTRVGRGIKINVHKPEDGDKWFVLLPESGARHTTQRPDGRIDVTSMIGAWPKAGVKKEEATA